MMNEPSISAMAEMINDLQLAVVSLGQNCTDLQIEVYKLRSELDAKK
ncbi:hypothetical protein M3580_03365 [Bacillus safensis]|nr:hypothetical protein [Bacillus safensis]MCM2988274.1 hypothetical protein [Bacillus safensis]